MEIKVPANKPYFPEEARRKLGEEISAILASGKLTQGPWAEKFEHLFAEYVGTTYAVSTNSGTSALEILLRYFDVQDREVIVPTNTFLASANAVLFAGGIPVLADIDPQTLNLNPDDILERTTPRTKGVIAVHIAGLISPQWEVICDICKQHNLFLIEDAAHAPGAASNSVKAGRLADGGAFSFYPSKPMTTGEGGMITTNDPECAHFARSVRCHGIAVGEEGRGKNKNLLVRLGHNWRMSEVQAVIGFHQLQNLDQAIVKRQEVADRYFSELSDVQGIQFFKPPENIRHSYYKFPLLLEKKQSRQTVSQRLREEFGIQCGSIYWPPCHLQPFYQDRFGYTFGDFPVAENILDRIICLPIHPQLTVEEIFYVKQALQQVLKTESEML